MSHPAPASPPILYTPAVERIEPEEQAVFADLDQTLSKIREKTFEDSGHARRSVPANVQGLFSQPKLAFRIRLRALQ